MKSLLKRYPAIRPHRKKVQSIGTLGLQAIMYLKAILADHFQARISVIQSDVLVTEPVKTEAAKQPGLYTKERERSIFIEMIFAVTEPVAQNSVQPKVIAQFFLEGNDGEQVWKPHHLSFFFENIANNNGGLMRLHDKQFIGF